MADSATVLGFPAVRGRQVTVGFDGGDLTSDAGLVLLAAADRKVGLTAAVGAVMTDRRQVAKVRHPLLEMVRERVYAIAQGYEDANDLDRLKADPALKTACARLPEAGRDLASQPTISRLENGLRARDLVRMGRVLAQQVIAQLAADTTEVVVDIDVTDDPCHGQQQLQFFNKFYDEHCYLPLLVYVTGGDGRQRLIGGLLRPGNVGATTGLWTALRAVVRLVRERFPDARIILRGDCGFGVAEVLTWCHRLRLDYVLGLAANAVVARLSTPVQMDAALKYRWQGDGCREFGEFEYAAQSWERPERVIVKAEITQGKLTPRCVVTSLRELTPQQGYDYYCARGDRENRIKELKLDLNSGRTSCHAFLANQARLLLHAAASALLAVLQAALEGTQWAAAQVSTLRTRLLKVGARVAQSCRRIRLHLPTAFPERETWGLLHRRL